jgi:hypothetical protein
VAQASVLTENEIRRVFRIIETTRHPDRLGEFCIWTFQYCFHEHLKFFIGFEGARQRGSMLVGIKAPSG